MRRVSGGPVVPDIRAVWQANTVFSPGDVFTYNGGVYEVTTTYTSGGSFGATDLANTTLWEAQSGTYALTASDSGQDTAGPGTGVLASINVAGGAQHNTAMGWNALTAATTAVGNTAIGWHAGAAITTGQENTLLGRYAGESITTAASVVALGTGAAKSTTINGAVTAVGTDALEWLTTGAGPTAVGYKCLQNVTTGGRNTGVGYTAGFGAQTNAVVAGNDNTFVGYGASPSDTSDPSGTTAVGSGALVKGNNATAIGKGAQALATGSVAIGVDSSGAAASTSTINEIKLGTAGHAVTLLNTLNIGNPGTNDGTINLKGSATTGSALLNFMHDATIDWRIYHPTGDSNFYFRDQVNGVFALYFTPAAGNNGQAKFGGVIMPVQAVTGSAPTYVKGGVYFDTTLNKLRVGGATAWETVTSA